MKQPQHRTTYCEIYSRTIFPTAAHIPHSGLNVLAVLTRVICPASSPGDKVTDMSLNTQ